MARRIIVTDPNADRFGIRITDPTGRVGWIVGQDCDYLLFDSEAEASKALRKMKNNDNYSWNCEAVVAKFTQ